MQIKNITVHWFKIDNYIKFIFKFKQYKDTNIGDLFITEKFESTGWCA